MSWTLDNIQYITYIIDIQIHTYTYTWIIQYITYMIDIQIHTYTYTCLKFKNEIYENELV